MSNRSNRARSAAGVWLSLALAIGIGVANQSVLSAAASAHKHSSSATKLKAGVTTNVKSGRLVSDFSPYPPMVNPVRIGLSTRAQLTRFAVWDPGFVFVNGQPVMEIHPGQIYAVSGGAITELASGRRFVMPMDSRVHVSARDYRIWTGNVWYRGCLELINFGHSVTSIDLLDLEDYLLGVVPSEMPASWRIEALKAQAVAARSYAWAHVGAHSKWVSEGFDLVPDVRDQAYKGLAREAPSTYYAVQQTRGLILKDSGRVKAGFYRAWVGDDLEQNLNIRKGTVPSAVLEKITGVQKIVGVTVKKWDANGNAHDIAVMGAKKTREVYGVALAHMLNFSTAGILDVHEAGSNWVFTYRGPGNGERGLSQNGAQMLAVGGWRFDQILQQFYMDTDGKLRLDYIEHYHPTTALMMPVPKGQAAQPASDKAGGTRTKQAKGDSDDTDSTTDGSQDSQEKKE